MEGAVNGGKENATIVSESIIILKENISMCMQIGNARDQSGTWLFFRLVRRTPNMLRGLAKMSLKMLVALARCRTFARLHFQKLERPTSQPP